MRTNGSVAGPAPAPKPRRSIGLVGWLFAGATRNQRP